MIEQIMQAYRRRIVTQGLEQKPVIAVGEDDLFAPEVPVQMVARRWMRERIVRGHRGGSTGRQLNHRLRRL